MENGSHIFFLGILTHWTCLVITKENHQSSLFYMDSMNRPSLMETDETIEKWLLGNYFLNFFCFSLEL